MMENKDLQRLEELKNSIGDKEAKEEVKEIDNSIEKILAYEFNYLEIRLFKGIRNYIDDTYGPIHSRLTRIETKQHELGDKLDKLAKALNIDKKQEEIAEYLEKLKSLI